jgi:hypothetical protein
LQQRGALIMIAVGMADDHIFNVAGVEAEFGEAFDNLRFDRPTEIGVDHDDAATGRECP